MANALIIQAADKNKPRDNRKWLPSRDQLSNTQKEILRPPIPKTQLITGPAGVGKSVLAIYFNKAVGDGVPKIIFVYGNILQSFMRFNSDEHNSEIANIHAVMKYISKEYKLRGNIHDVAKNISKRLRNIDKGYESIIIDEAQDFNKDLIKFCANHTKNYLTVFADNAQKLFDHGISDDVITGILKTDCKRDVTKKEILENFRNQPVVAEFAKPFYLFNQKNQIFPSAPQIGIREKVKVYNCKNYNPLKKGLVKQTLEYINSRESSTPSVGILVQSESRLNLLKQWFHEEGIISEKITNIINFGTNNPIAMTMQSSKGLEFDYVIIADLKYDQLKKDFPDNYKNIIFVAITRARRSLCVFLVDNSENTEFLELISNTNCEIVELG